MTFPSLGLDIYAPTFTVKLVNSNETIPRGDISSLEIIEDLEYPGQFTIKFNDALDMKKQKFRWLDNDMLQPRNLVELSFSYASSAEKNILAFLGRIDSVSHDFDFSGKAILSVKGYDLSHDLQNSWGEEHVYNDKTYSKIVADIASGNKLKRGKVDETKQVFKNISRMLNEDDYKFIKRLARDIGYEFFVRKDSFDFRMPQDDKDPQITFTNGINLISFTPGAEASTLVHEVTATSWDMNKKEKISQTAKLGDISKCVYIPPLLKGQTPEKKIPMFINGLTAAEAKIRSIARLKRENENVIKGSLESIGNPSLRPGLTINIEGVGKRFSGVYYIKKAKHSMNQDKYRTTLELRRCR